MYDTLGNLIEYKYNGFTLDESKECGVIPGVIGTCRWEYTYDGRGNLVSNDKYTRTTSGMAWQNEETYVYDETNHMVDAKNEQGEHSLYTYNGLGLRVGRELIMQDNTHGYTDFHDETPSVETGLNKPEVAVESYVIDYTSPTFRTLTMEEEGGFDYRWVYGLDKLSVKITSEGTNWWGQNVKQDILKDYLHQDRLGNTTNLTDKFGRVVGRADYNEWGEITYKDALDITSAYRRIYPQLNYTGHDWDDVLEMYYAKARFYDPDAKRFVEIDPVKGSVTDPLSLVSYLYCVDNPLRWVDPLGLVTITFSNAHLNGKVDLYSVSGANFSGGKANDQYVSLTDFVSMVNANYNLTALNKSHIAKLPVEYAGFTRNNNSFTFRFGNKSHDVGIANSIKGKNGEYFIKFECLGTLVNALGIGAATNKTGKVFDPSQYTGNGGKVYANTLLTKKLQDGSITFKYLFGMYDQIKITTQYYHDYDPSKWSKQPVEELLEKRNKQLKKMDHAGDLGTAASFSAAALDWILTYFPSQAFGFLSGIGATPIGDVVEMVKYNQWLEELNEIDSALEDAVATDMVIREKGFQFYLMPNSPGQFQYIKQVREGFIAEAESIKNAFLATREGTLNAFAPDYKAGFINRIDEVIKQNTDGSGFAEAKKQALQELNSGKNK